MIKIYMCRSYDHWARFKNMLVCRRPCRFFRVYPAGWKKGFFYHFEIEEITLIFIYLTWFSSSSLHSTSCVYFLCNMHATIMNLAYFNPHNLQLTTPWNLAPTAHSFLFLFSLNSCGWDDGVTIHWKGRSVEFQWSLNFFLDFLFSLLIFFFFF